MEDKMVRVMIQAIGAGCALIGILANKELATSADRDALVHNAWECGDKMAEEFTRRAKATEGINNAK